MEPMKDIAVDPVMDPGMDQSMDPVMDPVVDHKVIEEESAEESEEEEEEEEESGSDRSWYEEDGFVTNSNIIETVDKGSNPSAEISTANIIEGKRKRQKTIPVDIWQNADVIDDFNASEYEEAAQSIDEETNEDDSDESWKEGEEEGDSEDEGDEGEDEEEEDMEC